MRGDTGLIRRIIAGTLGAWLSLAMPVCANAAPQPDTIRIAVINAYASGAVQLSGVDYAIEKEGWLKSELAKRGYKFEWYPVANAAVGPLINEGFTSHVIQFASYSDLPSIILNASGSNAHTVALVPTTPSDGYLLVPKDSPAKTIEDLKGKRLAIHKGRPWELTLLHLLDSKGLSYDDFQIYNINPDAGAAAVATGGVDALFTITPYTLTDRGVAKVIWSSQNAPPEWKQWGGFWGDRDFVAKNPEIAQLVVTAYVRAEYWLSQDSNKDEAVKAGTLNGTVNTTIRHILEDPTASWKDHWSPLFSKAFHDHYVQSIAYALDKKIIRNPLNADDIIDDRFVTTALRDLKLEGYWTRSNATAAPLTPAVR